MADRAALLAGAALAAIVGPQPKPPAGPLSVSVNGRPLEPREYTFDRAAVVATLAASGDGASVSVTYSTAPRGRMSGGQPRWPTRT